MALKHGWVRNPLSVIAIFAGVAEISGAAVLPRLNGEVQVVFMFFVMFFPCALVGLFFYVLWFKAKVLYAPGDYKNDETFERMHGVVFSANGENATQAIHTSNSEPVSPASAYANTEGPVDSKEGTSNSAISESASSVREPKAPYGTPHGATEKREGEGEGEGEGSNEINAYTAFKTASEKESSERYISEQRVLVELHKRYGGSITAPAIMSTAGGPSFMIDGFINAGSRQYFVEVVYLPRPGSVDRFRGPGKRLAMAWEAVPVEHQKMTTCILCIAAKNDAFLGIGNLVHSYLARTFPDVNVQVETINTSQLG